MAVFGESSSKLQFGVVSFNERQNGVVFNGKEVSGEI